MHLHLANCPDAAGVAPKKCQLWACTHIRRRKCRQLQCYCHKIGFEVPTYYLRWLKHAMS